MLSVVQKLSVNSRQDNSNGGNFMFSTKILHFRLADGWPKELHGRVVFLPEAAFPLSNGSVILISVSVMTSCFNDMQTVTISCNDSVIADLR